MRIQIISKGNRRADVDKVLEKVSKDLILQVKEKGGIIKPILSRY
jgi:hypothetical protein